jgi:hypothetical protein
MRQQRPERVSSTRSASTPRGEPAQLADDAIADSVLVRLALPRGAPRYAPRPQVRTSHTRERCVSGRRGTSRHTLVLLPVRTSVDQAEQHYAAQPRTPRQGSNPTPNAVFSRSWTIQGLEPP